MNNIIANNIKMKTDSNQTRLTWIDWMKTIGMYFIVLGHFFTTGFVYVYVFSVPLFFLISGFLCKREENNVLFWKKIWYNLVIPMLFLSIANFLYKSLRWPNDNPIEIQNIFKFVIGLFGGMQSSLGTCWFVYTLVVIKIIYQYSHRITYNLVYACLFMIGAFLYNNIPSSDFPYMDYANSIVNVCTAYPFFFIGNIMRRYKGAIEEFNNKICLFALLLIGIVLIYFCGEYNGYVWMYLCGYGSNIVMFLLGGIAGSVSVFALSKLLGQCPGFVEILSIGTILILGVHGKMIDEIRVWATPSACDFLYAALILLLFVPLTKLAEKYFPIVLGMMRVKRMNL